MQVTEELRREFLAQMDDGTIGLCPMCGDNSLSLLPTIYELPVHKPLRGERPLLYMVRSCDKCANIALFRIEFE